MERIETVSVLFVRSDGPYPSLVTDFWTEARDARNYAGPNPAIAHPPCARWGNFALRWHGQYGNDGGCFESALASVRRFGGVLEHPRGSAAWKTFGIAPAQYGRWIPTAGGWTTAVNQGTYGHRARKATWLYCVSNDKPPDLDWSEIPSRMDCEHMGKKERELTPWRFAHLLLSIAIRCR
jgi:hypothetical protein